MSIHDLPGIAQILQRHGLGAHKKFGQHYLFDLNLTEKIVRLSGVTANDLVIEIGPGPGGLTRPLLSTGAKVLVIETDPKFTPLLEELQTVTGQQLELFLEDALKVNLDELTDGKPYKVVANLPYNVGTALLINWLTAPKPGWQSLTLMFQLEVAERITAKAGSSHYGRLSILTAATASAELVMHIPARAFTPPPKVASAVVHLEPLPPEQRFADLEVLARLTAMAFGQKRKMLRASLKPLGAELGQDISDWLSAQKIDPTARPETLSPTQFMMLATKLHENTKRP
ncbi:MAG: 16S rRNA (adenine(1518)-N(6)/adenine(1519)-N(6))-dimethyltransferase [Robiginitomaculum sp.]|nr:MAG: 16S rRNA (adenine(1518)-N(6)/adenine(1519)-N(6))-dimethyltransferase [Robiginitomaculum sp.]